MTQADKSAMVLCRDTIRKAARYLDTLYSILVVPRTPLGHAESWNHD
jgi:hypothetical protein